MDDGLPNNAMEPSARELTPDAPRLIAHVRQTLVRGRLALHVAMAAVHGLDYLLTWNCRHIANATLRGKIEELCRAAGFEPPTICTPLELPKE